MGLWGAQPLFHHLLHFVLFLLLRVDVEGGPVLAPLISKEQVTIPPGPLMSLPHAYL